MQTHTETHTGAPKAARRPARRKLTATQKKLAAMLVENTGRALGDSGDAYGRNWQRNQGRDFASEPAAVLAPVVDWVKEGAGFEPEVTLNVFHFLDACLTYDADMNRRYQAFARKRREDDYEPTICEDFVTRLRDQGHRIGGLYGEGEPMTVNTYNGEDLLSQTLQYLYFTCDGTDYVLLQIHGGCDVRGGYTDAVAFEASDNYGTSIYDNARATIQPEPDPAAEGREAVYWYTDDGWHWYFQGASPGGPKLRDAPVTRDAAKRGDGEHIWLDADGAPHCPVTGRKLVAHF